MVKPKVGLCWRLANTAIAQSGGLSRGIVKQMDEHVERVLQRIVFKTVSLVSFVSFKPPKKNRA